MQDVSTLGIINVRYCGYVAVVKVDYDKKSERPLPQNVDINDQTEGGANALNINRSENVFNIPLLYVFLNLKNNCPLEQDLQICWAKA